MNPLFACAEEVQDYCRSRDWGFCLVGGIAVMRWSGHRVTPDVDLEVVTPFGDEPTMIEGFYRRFEPRFEDCREFSARTRVVKFIASNGVTVDVALGRSRRLLRMISRASVWDPEGSHLLTCGAEDLIVNKTVSGRPHDWDDIEHVVASRGDALDAGLVMREFVPIAQQSHHLTDPLSQLQRSDRDEAIGLLVKALGVAKTAEVDRVSAR